MNPTLREREALQRLADALANEEKTRAALRAAQEAQAKALIELRELGVPATLAALRIARLRGEALSVSDRRRIAECLRKRAQRRTGCLADVSRPRRHPALTARPSNRALRPEKENEMKRLVKRITEEFVETKGDEDEDLDGIEEDGEAPEDIEEEDEHSTPVRRRTR